jgi:hypothetical protein
MQGSTKPSVRTRRGTMAELNSRQRSDGGVVILSRPTLMGEGSVESARATTQQAPRTFRSEIRSHVAESHWLRYSLTWGFLF